MGLFRFIFLFQTFPAEVPIFLREHQNRMYRVISYYLAKILIDVNFFLIHLKTIPNE
jgi:hypothetical protein